MFYPSWLCNKVKADKALELINGLKPLQTKQNKPTSSNYGQQALACAGRWKELKDKLPTWKKALALITTA